MFLIDQQDSKQVHIYLGTHKNNKVFIDQVSLRAFLIIQILNPQTVQANSLGPNFLMKFLQNLSGFVSFNGEQKLKKKNF